MGILTGERAKLKAELPPGKLRKMTCPRPFRRLWIGGLWAAPPGMWVHSAVRPGPWARRVHREDTDRSWADGLNGSLGADSLPTRPTAVSR